MSAERLNGGSAFDDGNHNDDEQARLVQDNVEVENKGSRHAFFSKLENFSDEQEKLNWSGSFEEYFELAVENPGIARTAYQTTYNALTSREDFFTTGNNALYGADEATKRYIEILRAGSQGLEIGKRIILLAGPPGSGKSTLVNGTKRALEEYSKTEEGAIYAIQGCPMNEEPLHLIPKEMRESMNEEYGLSVDGDLCPVCEEKYGNAFKDREVLDGVVVERVGISEKKRVGIGTFKPSDPKSQDITELIGSVDYSQLGEHGSASDASAYRFDGELNKANRGVMEFVEMLKSDEKFLYTLLDLTQDRVIKAPRFPNIHADEVILAHTNMSEYYSYTQNPKNEALKDRMVVIEVPYTLQVSEESKIHEKLIGQSEIARKQAVHISPKTYEMASTFGVLTRLNDGNKYDKLQKLKMYNGQENHDLNNGDINEIHKEDKKARAGMHGVSPRYIIDSLSMALSKNDGKTCLNPMDAINALRANLEYHPHTRDMNDKDKAAIMDDVDMVYEEFNRQAEEDVKKSFVYSFEETARSLSNNYLKHVEAYRNRSTVVEDDEMEYEPDERLMRSIEEQAGISESGKDEYRKEIIINIGAAAMKGEKFDYTKLPRLRKAIENKLFHDLEDVISLTTSASVPNEDQKEKIQGVQKRMVEEQGYCVDCAHKTVQHVGRNLSRTKS